MPGEGVVGRVTAAVVGAIETGVADMEHNGEIRLSGLRRHLEQVVKGLLLLMERTEGPVGHRCCGKIRVLLSHLVDPALKLYGRSRASGREILPQCSPLFSRTTAG